MREFRPVDSFIIGMLVGLLVGTVFVLRDVKTTRGAAFGAKNKIEYLIDELREEGIIHLEK